ncbi:uncharacterized protein QC761_111440 [Podospora bellae-mahoneyi]|uniref:Uncharacterized protein n=1 Tax=Podospora bellae-mahoneyi TaxID=2093777 RepID=A0ABR0FYT2_9PEZI|nr:hypothetical protein QC761_111440 [Podospora bellae-mahoneyi]
MAITRKQEREGSYRPESSWRMVEGSETGSFAYDEEIVPSNSDPSNSFDSQPVSIGASQPWSIGGSQDESIETYLSKAENDEQFILKSPFRPSVPQSVRHSSKEQHREPGPEFVMPKVEVESPTEEGGSAWSSTTIKSPKRPTPPPGLRKRLGMVKESPRVRGRRQSMRQSEELERPVPDDGILGSVFSWMLDVIGLAFWAIKYPIGFLLAVYVLSGTTIIAKNMVTKSLAVSLSPLCRLPGVSYLNVPFCGPNKSEDDKPANVDFDSLVDAQSLLEQVLERTVEGVTLPLDIKRSEASIRDLRTIVRHSNLKGKQELVLEFDGYIDTVRSVVHELSSFNVHVGSTVDSVISMNRWTARQLDTLEGDNVLKPRIENNDPWLSQMVEWVLSPFQPVVFTEDHLKDTYLRHASHVQDRIASLILEAQTVLSSLTKAEDHLEIIHEVAHRSTEEVKTSRQDILYTLWTLVGANNQKLKDFKSQLSVLGQIETQRLKAVKQVTGLVSDLIKIQAEIQGLRDEVSAAELVPSVPLSVHIATINSGVERLDSARARLKAIEAERVREVVGRGREGGERLIDSKRW